MIKCPECNREFIKIRSMKAHYRWHNIPKFLKMQQSIRKKCRDVNIGKQYMLGYHHSKKTKELQSTVKLSEKNPMWKGDDASILAIHRWIESRKKKPKYCSHCKKSKPYDLANISGKYKRDVDDYLWLCRSCHMKYDYKNGVRVWKKC